MSPSNLTLYSNLQDPYSKYGLKHFLLKFGIQLAVTPQEADIYVGYWANNNGDRPTQILINPDTVKKTVYLNIDNTKIPLFTKPQRTSGNLNLGESISENEIYHCLSISGDTVLIGFDIFGEIGRILAGVYDNEFQRKDQIGEILRSIPVVDLLEDTLFSAISHIIPGTKQNFSWPDGHKFALVLTHDVDRVHKTYQYLPSILNSVKKANLSELGYHLNNLLFKHGQEDPYWTFESICEVENSLGVKSSYYFLNEKGKHNPFSPQSWILYKGVYDIECQPVKQVIRKLFDMKFEIGVHGSYNSYNNQDLLQSEKHVLETILGTPIRGIRQHFLNYDNDSTPEIHHNIGFGYDTSLGVNPELGAGFRRGTSFPFPVLLPDLNISPVVELPLIVQDVALKNKCSVKDCLYMLGQVEKHHGVLTLLWHTRVFNRREYPDMTEIYKEIIKEAKSKNAWIATAIEVYDWVNKSMKNPVIKTYQDVQNLSV